jgi:hypothetical protein
MVWSAPMTAVAGSVFTSAQFNQYVRDNLNMTAPALASAAGQIFVSDGVNSIQPRTPSSAYIATSATTTGTSYGDLSDTAGPTVTVTTGVQAIVGLYAALLNSGANNTLMGFAVSGASSVGAADNFAIGNNGTAGIRYGAWFIVSLTAGSNTFTAKYKVNAGTGTAVDRRILVIPL